MAKNILAIVPSLGFLLLFWRTVVSLTSSMSTRFDIPVRTIFHESGFLELQLSRTKKMNSLDTESLLLLESALESVTTSRGRCKGILITAVSGRAFCAGGDIAHVAGLTAAQQIAFLHLEYGVHQRIMELWLLHDVPVVAIADGIVMGAGAGLFMAAQFR